MRATSLCRPALVAALSLILPCAATAQEADDYAKLGPNAVAITADAAYLRSAPAPDYWAFAPFTKPQFTSSACSIATVTAAINGIMGQPQWASQTIMSQTDLLELTGNSEWAALSAEDGDGVTFAQLVSFTTQAADAAGMADATVRYWKPDEHEQGEAIDQLRQLLTENEARADNAIMVYFNQGVVTGDWDGPHISLIGAYDAAQDRVLILEVDQEWYIPYWTSVDTLMAAMVKPTSAEHGVLEGETGGFVMISAAG